MNNQYQTEGYLNSAVGFSKEEVIEGEDLKNLLAESKMPA